MADDSPLTLSKTLIGGRYAVDTSQALADAGGGLPAYLARDRMASDRRHVAVAVSRDASPRTRHLKVLAEPIDYLMVPLAHGIAPLSGGKGEGYFVICPPPPGPPVSAPLNPWPDKALVDFVLRPVAGVLDALHSRKLTHRSIRPNNVFQAAPGHPVMLGTAWAAPPAMHQPAVCEAPYSAMCHPACRGDGLITDDIYALGVLLLTLSGGKLPMRNMDDATIIQWKLDLGSFAALTRDFSLSGFMTDLLRGMLAEDPDHRPLPNLLLEVSNSRTRRIAARPARRSQSALILNDVAVFDARALAFALFRDEKKAIQFLRNGLVTQWLRRSLGDASLASQIEDLVRKRMAETTAISWSDPLLLMRTISVLNPHMPLCWRGIALWPDALAAMLAEGIAAKPQLMAAVEELLITDIVTLWSDAESRPSHTESFDTTQLRLVLKGGGPGGLLRLFYELNPLLPCRISAMAPDWVASMQDLMRFLEKMAERASESLIDIHLAAFIASRADRKIEMQVNALQSLKNAESFRLAELTLLRDIQSRYHPSSMPALAKWVAARLRPSLDQWNNRRQREAMLGRLDALAQAGIISPLLELAQDTTARILDIAGAQQATNELARIDAELAAIDSGDSLRLANIERFGQAIAGGLGLSVFVLTAMAVLLR